jgi:heme-degrading monooxygenase HmoA
MSVVLTMKVPGDTEKFRSFISSEASRLTGIADSARAGGCIHHRFAIGDGYVLVVDEWESAEAFQKFFQDNEQIAEVMREAGAQGEPEFEFAEAVDSADQF